MESDWTQPIVMLAAIFGVFLWLRNDINSLRKEARTDMQQLRADMQHLRADMQGEMQHLRADMQGEFQQLRTESKSDIQRLELKIDGLDSRLRAVETEQSRVAGLLEGLALSGALPDRES